jgi:hypothetical protein
MPAFFFDSSALVKRFAQEQGSAFVLGLLRPSVKSRLYSARITEVEVCSALARRQKGNTITASDGFSRFRAVGEQIHYRTVYAALCSQTHNDAEDLLNNFAVHLTSDEALHQSLAKETESFSWLLTAVAVDDFSHAVACFLVMYDLIDPAAPIKELCRDADRLVADALSQTPPRSTTGG